MRRLFLYGAPASGKTTLGRRLAIALGARFVDLDEAIAASAGRSIPAIFAEQGEAGFRGIESLVLRETVADDSAEVVALGGGTLLNPENRHLCEMAGDVVCIDTPPPDVLDRRLAAAGGARPLGNKALERAAHYASFPKRLNTWFDLVDSLVLVGEAIAPAFMADERIVADGNVARLHREITPLAVIPPGEENKTPEMVMRLWSEFARAGIGRHDRVLSVGGGVSGDLTGFAAATWMRGIDWINVPTTLLAMVDASVGGKTACDLPEGKNLAGAFHSPRLVAIDVDFLKTLSRESLADGKAEMIKHEIIGNLNGLSAKVGISIPSAGEIAENLKVKVGIVRDDPLESKGLRMVLNCGHTVGHALEKASGYKLSHGQCVAIGCVAEARLAVKLGLARPDWPCELASRFAAAGLPVDYPEGICFESLKALMRGDKKKSAVGSVVFALPCGAGDVRLKEVSLA